MKVLYFGHAREAAGTREEEFSLPKSSSVRTLLTHSQKLHRDLQGMHRTMRVAVNEEIAADNHLLADGDVVAFLPPVAGG